MDEHGIRKMLEGGGGTRGALLRAALWLPGKLYGTAMRLRRLGYRHHLLASRAAPVPVISIGNLTAGGSGKTPLTAMLARQLAADNLRPAIILRGYRAGDGDSDEAILYRRLCPKAIIEVDPDRHAGALHAAARGADFILMDDGFQHLRLRRDFDIVLIDATSPWGGNNTIPGGLLREPRAALRHADAIVITRTDQVPGSTLDRIRHDISILAYSTPVYMARHRPARLLRLDGLSLPLQTLKNKRVVALSGIARPEAFHKTLAELGAKVVATRNGRDHDQFTDAFLAETLAAARELGAVTVITEKDGAKNIFTRLADNNLVDNTNVVDTLWTLGIEQEVESGAELLDQVRLALRQRAASAAFPGDSGQGKGSN